MKTRTENLFCISSISMWLLVLAAFVIFSMGSGIAATVIPDSEMSYSGASTTVPFKATEPYILNIQGSNKTISLGGASRSHDLGGTAPFVNPTTAKNDPFVFQAYSKTQGLATGGNDPWIVDWYGSQITNAGVIGRIEKTTWNNIPVTMVKYNAGDGITYEKCRTKIGAFVIPPRTHVKW